MQEQIREILTWIAGFVGGGTGIGFIAFVVSQYFKYKAKTKVAQSAKLTEDQIEEIADRAAKKIEAKIKGKLTIDIDAELDKATNKRLKAVEEQQEQLVDVMNRTYKLTRANVRAFGSFHTVDKDSKAEIAELIKSEDLNPIANIQEEKPSVVFEKEEEKKAEPVEQKPKITY